MPTRYDKEFKQNIINLYKQGESAAQLAHVKRVVMTANFGAIGFSNHDQTWALEIK